MNELRDLETRVKSLIDLTNRLKKENDSLRADKMAAEAQYKELELSVSQDSKHVGKLKEEQELTKMAVDDLIQSIDSLITNEQQS